MSVYDNELIINGQAVRSPEQQVYKNMKDIEELKRKIQTWYASSVNLNTSDNTILRSNTNVPDDVESGLLIDPTGNMFNITGGDETTLLITFYANIQGPQGETGTPGASSNDKGTYITHVEPTLDDDIYTLSTGNIDNVSSDNIPVQVNDLIIYIDSNDQPTSVYTVASISGTTLTLSKQGDYAKGKQLYKHNIFYSAGGSLHMTLTIICDTATAINGDNWSDFWSSHSNMLDKWLIVSGVKIVSSTIYPIICAKVILDNIYYKFNLGYLLTASGSVQFATQAKENTSFVTDSVIAL